MSATHVMARRCLILAIAKTLQQYAGNHAEERALDVMTDLVERMMEETGRRAGQYRDLAGRNSGSWTDVERALEELGVQVSDLVWTAPTKSVGLDHVPSFPIPGGPELGQGARLGDAPQPLPAEAEEWMPPLPPRHAYQRTDVAVEEMDEAEAQRVRGERRTQVEGYLEKLASGKRGREETTEGQEAVGVLPKQVGLEVDQSWADAHALRQVKGARVEVQEEEGLRAGEDEEAYNLRLKAEKILANRDP